MARILLIAQGEYIAEYGLQLRERLDDPEEFEVVVAHMEDAVAVAGRSVRAGVEVIIARAITATLLREAGLNVAVVDIPISNEEIFASISKARALAGIGAPIGFLGFKPEVESLTSILNRLGVSITLYDVQSTRQNHEQLAQAKKDGIEVMIGGELSAARIRKAGMRAVVLAISPDSIRRAFVQAKGLADALAAERKKTQEAVTIFDSVSDAIVSLDAGGRVTLINRLASRILIDAGGGRAERAADIFPPREVDAFFEVMRTGSGRAGDIFEKDGVKYALRIVPTMVGGAAAGAVATLQEIRQLQRIEASVRRELYQKGNTARYVFDDIRGRSEAVRGTVETARTFAALQSSVLLYGETGTGKELFAQSIHNAGPRRDGPFVAVNCGAIPANLMESELFGYEDGAFTGSKKGGRMGLFEQAHRGTIFLDEVSEMDPAGQVNLLRALQERQIRRVGGGRMIPVDVRIIAACNADLAGMVKSGRFRRDLYYRLCVLVLKIPPLRKRPGDAALLASQFIGEYAERFGKRAALSEAAAEELETFAWEGNIRQLRNFCERLVAVAERPVIDTSFLRKNFADSFPDEGDEGDDAAGGNVDGGSLLIKGVLYSRNSLLRLLAEHGGNREAVARHLGVSRTTLWKYMRQLRLP